jgi:hypothetical protein
MTRRQVLLPLLAAATVTTVLLAQVAGRDAASANRSDSSAAAPSRTAASHVAVRLLHALTDDDPDRAATAITATSTPALVHALLAARQHTHAPARSRMALTVTSVATDVTGTHADVRVTGQLGVASTNVAVAWTLRLVVDSRGGWRVEAVS